MLTASQVAAQAGDLGLQRIPFGRERRHDPLPLRGRERLHPGVGQVRILGNDRTDRARIVAPAIQAWLVERAGFEASATVARWFTARRGFAVELATSGAGVGILVCPPLVERLLDSVGWRLTYATLAPGCASR